MMRLERRLALAAITAFLVAASASPPGAGPSPESGRGPAPAPAPDRFRLVLNASFWPTQTTFSDSRTFTEYAEQTTIRTSYERAAASARHRPPGEPLPRAGRPRRLLHVSRDVTGHVDVSRPHPLYLNRNRSASSEISGYGLTEGAVHLDLRTRARPGTSTGRSSPGSRFPGRGHLLQAPTYDDVYPYDEMTITSTPSTTAKESPSGFNVAAGSLSLRELPAVRSRRDVRYSTASVKLKATPDATEATFDAGGLAIGAGLRVYSERRTPFSGAPR